MYAFRSKLKISQNAYILHAGIKYVNIEANKADAVEENEKLLRVLE